MPQYRVKQYKPWKGDTPLVVEAREKRGVDEDTKKWIVEELHECDCSLCDRKGWNTITGWFDTHDEAVAWVRQQFPNAIAIQLPGEIEVWRPGAILGIDIP